jgi:hypothetical protein
MNAAEQVLACYAKGMRYQETAKAIGLDKNKIYAITLKLQKSGRIRRVSAGQYEVVNGAAAQPDVVDIIKVYQLRDVAPPKKVEPVPESPPPPPPEESLDTIATNLLGKVGYLQPLLLLHKELFEEIQSLTLKIVERLNDAQPRTLSASEFGEWIELMSIKKEAESYAARHRKQ